jgi:hypothetical protein
VGIVASAVVVWRRETREVDGVARSLPLYPKRHRRIALVVLDVTALLTVLFTIRVGSDYLRSEQADRQNSASVSPVPVATNGGTPSPTIAGAPSATRISGSATPAFGQIGDVKVLNKMGFDALATKNYTVAVPAFFRALEVDATNAQAQLGL